MWWLGSSARCEYAAGRAVIARLLMLFGIESFFIAGAPKTMTFWCKIGEDKRMVVTVLLFVLGLIIIIKGGDWFVDASVWIANRTGMPRILIGATVVSLATTLPEFFVSVLAVSQGATELGIGNAIGSIICNTGLILAISVAIRPPQTERGLFLVKAGFMALSLVMLFVFCLDGILSVPESLLLILLFALFVYYNIKHARKQRNHVGEEIKAEGRPGTNILKFIFGAAGIVVGARLLVSSSVTIAEALGISGGVIGVTVVALGTSLPEFVTTITALRKKEGALGIGNILGANFLNVTYVLSSSALVAGGLVLESNYIPMLGRIMPRSLYIDIPVAALLFMLLIVPPLLLKGRLRRLQGVLMLAVYAAFIVFLVVNI